MGWSYLLLQNPFYFFFSCVALPKISISVFIIHLFLSLNINLMYITLDAPLPPKISSTPLRTSSPPTGSGKRYRPRLGPLYFTVSYYIISTVQTRCRSKEVGVQRVNLYEARSQNFSKENVLILYLNLTRGGGGFNSFSHHLTNSRIFEAVRDGVLSIKMSHSVWRFHRLPLSNISCSDIIITSVRVCFLCLGI